MSFSDKPKFLCRRRVLARLDDKNFKLTCVVRSIPPVNSVTLLTDVKENSTSNRVTFDKLNVTTPLGVLNYLYCLQNQNDMLFI